MGASFMMPTAFMPNKIASSSTTLTFVREGQASVSTALTFRGEMVASFSSVLTFVEERDALFSSVPAFVSKMKGQNTCPKYCLLVNKRLNEAFESTIL